MEHFIICNQKAFASLSDKMDIKDAAVFNWIIRFFHTDTVEQRFHLGNLYFRLDYNYVISQLPLLNINNTDGIYRRLKKLQSVGLLEPHPDNGRIVE